MFPQLLSKAARIIAQDADDELERGDGDLFRQCLGQGLLCGGGESNVILLVHSESRPASRMASRTSSHRRESGLETPLLDDRHSGHPGIQYGDSVGPPGGGLELVSGR